MAMAAAKTPPPTYAPRPSISPLSTASKANKQSPIATRDAMMQDAELQEDVERNHAAANGDTMGMEDDDGSSELSEPDDDMDEENHGNGMGGDLSEDETAAAQKSLEVDSEAETERLDQTPQGQRKQADAMGKTPSKLSQAATVEDELSDPPSPLPAGPGAASSTSTTADLGQKRKRSGTDESSLSSADSDLGESPRKRSHEAKADKQEHAEEATEEVDLPEEEEADGTVDTPKPDDAAAVPKRGSKGKKGKQKAKQQKEGVEETETEQAEDQADVPTETVEEDPEKKEEALKAKKDAMDLFESVAKKHRAFQELLNRERLADVARQLEMLNQEECIHPEYLRQVACVDARLQKQQNEARAYYGFKLRCIRERTLGERSQLHSQYFQTVRDLREDTLEKLGETACAIQNQRRLESIVPDNDDAYIYRYNPKKSVQIRQQGKYNQEVSVLSGIAKYVGFPAAPEIRGVEGGAIDDDLKAMKISKRASQPAPRPPVYIPPANNSTTAQNERLAHEQFIERNAWAQPQGPLHTLNTPNISHTPDWADQPFTGTGGPAKHLIRNLSGQQHGSQRTGSPYATPAPQKRAPMDFSSSGTVAMNNSDGPENPPSSVAAAPPTSQRISILNDNPSTQGPGGPQSSPLTVPKHRVQQHTPAHDREPAPREKELTGFRNISNLSNASTIDAPLHSSQNEHSHPHPHIHQQQPHLHHHHQNHQPHYQGQHNPIHVPPEIPPGPHAHLYRDLSGSGQQAFPHLPHLRHEDSAPLQAFETSGFHRSAANGGSRGHSTTPAGRREAAFPFVGAAPGFRAQEGVGGQGAS